MIGTLDGPAQAVLEGAREILAGISPLGRVRLSEDGSELVFEARWVKGIYEERLPAEHGLARELVRHAACRSRSYGFYEVAGRA